MAKLLILAFLFLSGCAYPLVVDMHSANAWATDRGILISPPLLELMQTPAERAFVMSHETAHHLLGHVATGSATKDEEIAADRFAFHMMREAGHDVCAGVAILERIYDANEVASPFREVRLTHWYSVWPECKE